MKELSQILEQEQQELIQEILSENQVSGMQMTDSVQQLNQQQNSNPTIQQNNNLCRTFSTTNASTSTRKTKTIPITESIDRCITTNFFIFIFVFL